jgi:heptosyltransferase-2
MNVAVFLPGWVGDAVMATPALRALRRRYPDAHMLGVVKPYVAGVLEGGDWFDEVMFSGGPAWSHGLLPTAWALRQRKIDLAVLLPNSFRTALIARLAGCRRRIGFGRYGRSLLLTDVLEAKRGPKGERIPSPVLYDYNRLAEAAGCAPPGRRMEQFVTPADVRAAEQVWRSSGLDTCAEVVCLNPGAAFGSAKHWPMEYFAALAGDLARRRGCGVLVLCGPNERIVCRQIVALTRHPAVVALAAEVAPARRDAPPLNLGLSKALVRRCDLLITTDSGPRHFAAAFNRPVVTLFGPTHIAWTETHYSLAIHLQKAVPCGPCQQRVCPLDHRCMRDLSPAEVFAAAVSLLDRKTAIAG